MPWAELLDVTRLLLRVGQHTLQRPDGGSMPAWTTWVGHEVCFKPACMRGHNIGATGTCIRCRIVCVATRHAI